MFWLVYSQSYDWINRLFYDQPTINNSRLQNKQLSSINKGKPTHMHSFKKKCLEIFYTVKFGNFIKAYIYYNIQKVFQAKEKWYVKIDQK